MVNKESSAKAKNFLILKDKRAIMWMSLLADIDTCLGEVSEGIQTNHSTVSDVWLELQGAKQILKSYMYDKVISKA